MTNNSRDNLSRKSWRLPLHGDKKMFRIFLTSLVLFFLVAADLEGRGGRGGGGMRGGGGRSMGGGGYRGGGHSGYSRTPSMSRSMPPRSYRSMPQRSYSQRRRTSSDPAFKGRRKGRCKIGPSESWQHCRWQHQPWQCSQPKHDPRQSRNRTRCFSVSSVLSTTIAKST